MWNCGLHPSKSQLLEVFVGIYVLRFSLKDEANMMATMVAWRELLAINTCDLMLLGVIAVMNDSVDARMRHFLSWLEFITTTSHWRSFLGKANVISRKYETRTKTTFVGIPSKNIFVFVSLAGEHKEWYILCEGVEEGG